MQNSISIIGGSDGPTSIFLVGKLGDGSWIIVGIVIAVIVAGIIAWKRRRKD